MYRKNTRALPHNHVHYDGGAGAGDDDDDCKIIDGSTDRCGRVLFEIYYVDTVELRGMVILGGTKKNNSEHLLA